MPYAVIEGPNVTSTFSESEQVFTLPEGQLLAEGGEIYTFFAIGQPTNLVYHNQP
jgi:hypothetical protein